LEAGFELDGLGPTAFAVLLRFTRGFFVAGVFGFVFAGRNDICRLLGRDTQLH